MEKAYFSSSIELIVEESGGHVVVLIVFIDGEWHTVDTSSVEERGDTVCYRVTQSMQDTGPIEVPYDLIGGVFAEGSRQAERIAAPDHNPMSSDAVVFVFAGGEHLHARKDTVIVGGGITSFQDIHSTPESFPVEVLSAAIHARIEYEEPVEPSDELQFDGDFEPRHELV